VNLIADPGAELAAALAAVQAELPEVKKNRSADVKSKEGKFLYKYAYADLADVSAAVMPVLGKHGLAFTAFPGHQSDGKFGLRYYLLHSGGGSIEGFFEIDDKGGMQLVGGRITYARRYCLCAVTGITADEDVDARDGQEQHSPTAQRRPRAQASPPAQAAPRAAAPVTPASRGAGGDLPPLPGETTRTAADYIAERMDALGVENRVRTAARIVGRVLPSLDDLNPAEANHVMRTIRGCKTATDLDGVLAEIEMRGGTDGE
jgi:hypothetical protein